MYVALAIVFLIALLLFIFYGWGIVMRRTGRKDGVPTEKCSICRREIERSRLIEREVGDYKLYYFCPDCIESLKSDLTQKMTGGHL
jgi:hypothetical protein